MKTLHVFSQDVWHDPAFIIGTKEGLEELKTALITALELDERGAGRADEYTRDGEGYEIIVKLLSDEDMQQLQLPYTDSCFREIACLGTSPYVYFKK